MAQRSAAPRSEVPFLHKNQIEREADLLLAEYAEIIEPITKPPIPIEEMVGSVVKLRHRFLDLNALFPFADVHGAIWFEEAIIGIDSSLNPDSFPKRRGRYHFTVAHEIGHWRLHREHYMRNPAQRLLFDDGSPQPDVVCRTNESKKSVEWQADCFAASVLMPRKLVHAAWAEFRGGDNRPVELSEIHAAHPGSPLFCRGQPASTEEERDNAAKEDFCRPLAGLFEVSREAMRIRLEGLELIVRERPPMLF